MEYELGQFNNSTIRRVYCYRHRRRVVVSAVHSKHIEAIPTLISNPRTNLQVR